MSSTCLALGALLMRMLGNRNLNSWQSAETFTRFSGGHLYLSAATVGAVGRDVSRLTPDLLAGFALVLGIPIGDLIALGDVGLPDGGVPAYSVPAHMAVLIWEVRHPTAEQVRAVDLHRALGDHDQVDVLITRLEQHIAFPGLPRRAVARKPREKSMSQARRRGQCGYEVAMAITIAPLDCR